MVRSPLRDMSRSIQCSKTLAIRDLAQRATVLARDADRMSALFGSWSRR